MIKTCISKSVFEMIFSECMKHSIIYNSDGSTGKGLECMTIRDFDTANPNNADNDVDFYADDFKGAWNYFKSIRRARVMDLNGNIYLDAFEGD